MLTESIRFCLLDLELLVMCLVRANHEELVIRHNILQQQGDPVKTMRPLFKAIQQLPTESISRGMKELLCTGLQADTKDGWVREVQTFFKRYHARPYALALCMGSHGRLGKESYLRLLPDDILATIWDMAREDISERCPVDSIMI